MRAKTAELTGTLLDWAVAKCEMIADKLVFIWGGIPTQKGCRGVYSPSTIWAQGGPIIEREGIDILNAENCGHQERWMAAYPIRFGARSDFIFGKTPLVAAMRCYVASKLGEEVDIPDELKTDKNEKTSAPDHEW